MDMMYSRFTKIREDAKKDGDAARMLADEGVTPEVGGVYTVSPDFNCGDRSWIDCFWRVISRSGPNVLVEIISERRQFMRLFLIADRAWYPAEAAFAAFEKAND